MGREINLIPEKKSLKNKKEMLPLPLKKNTYKNMGVTRLKRKDRKNNAAAQARVAELKRITAKPVIKNIDIEAIKKSFAEKKGQK